MLYTVTKFSSFFSAIHFNWTKKIILFCFIRWFTHGAMLLSMLFQQESWTFWSHLTVVWIFEFYSIFILLSFFRVFVTTAAVTVAAAVVMAGVVIFDVDVDVIGQISTILHFALPFYLLSYIYFVNKHLMRDDVYTHKYLYMYTHICLSNWYLTDIHLSLSKCARAALSLSVAKQQSITRSLYFSFFLSVFSFALPFARFRHIIFNNIYTCVCIEIYLSISFTFARTVSCTPQFLSFALLSGVILCDRWLATFSIQFVFSFGFFYGPYVAFLCWQTNCANNMIELLYPVFGIHMSCKSCHKTYILFVYHKRAHAQTRIHANSEWERER